MSEKHPEYQSFYERMSKWLHELREDEGKTFKNLVEKGEEYLQAAEDLSVNEYQLSVQGFKNDLRQFYQEYKQQAEQSPYLKNLREGVWMQLAKMTDKSQVEWSELEDDLEHKGIYHSGELIGFGQLRCINCDHTVVIVHPSKIIPCVKCNAQEFERQPLSP
ncbi:zinc ribbon-containing protein [Thalassotalea litorea]|uniref:zinc ribbon-containing protein n=1 Tax=Thalassotalea litorea TaxID=2020715 RepID=UPI00373522FD